MRLHALAVAGLLACTNAASVEKREGMFLDSVKGGLQSVARLLKSQKDVAGKTRAAEHIPEPRSHKKLRRGAEVEQPTLASGDMRGLQFTEGTVYARQAPTRTGAGPTVGGHYIEFVPGVVDQKEGAAFGTFDPAGMYTNGWGTMRLNSNPAVSDKVATFAVGYLEGALTHRFNHAYYHNMLSAGMRFPRGLPDTVKSYYDKHEDWVRSQLSQKADLERNPHDGAYWSHVGLVMSQYDGLLQGHNDLCEHGQQLQSHQMHILVGQLDLLDLRDAYTSNWHGEATPSWFNSSGNEHQSLERGSELLSEVNAKSMQPLWYRSGSSEPAQLTPQQEQALLSRAKNDPDSGHACSTYIRYVNEQQSSSGKPDILVGHSTWAPYSTMMRIFKHVNMPLQSSSAAIHEQVFAAFPGGAFPGSYDTFSMMRGAQQGAGTDTALASLEREEEEAKRQPLLMTAGGQFWVNDKPKLNLLKPSGSLMGWIRMAVASRTSATAEEFAQNFAHDQGSTYAGQLYIMDYAKLNANKGKGLPPKSVYYVETCPQKSAVQDHTSNFQDGGYVSTFNHPIVDEIRDFTRGGGLNGARDQSAKRATSKVSDVHTMQSFLMNDVGDQDDYGAYGAIDGKVANLESVSKLSTYAKSGTERPYALPEKGYLPFKHELLAPKFANSWEQITPGSGKFAHADSNFEEQMPVSARPIYNPEAALKEIFSSDLEANDDEVTGHAADQEQVDQQDQAEALPLDEDVALRD